MYINGLYMEGSAYDTSQDSMIEQKLGVMYSPMPPIKFEAITNY